MQWAFTSPVLTIDLLFALIMDSSVTPLPADLVILADGVPKLPLTTIWATNQRLTVTYDEPSLNPTTVRLQLPASVQDFRDATLHVVFPFDILGVEV